MPDRILSGTRPTGRLHIGNYLGAIANWVENQNQNAFYMIADWHVLTTDYEAKNPIRDLVFQVGVDLLSCGLDPEKCVLFVQSHVKAHSELSLILSMITPIAWLERNPAFKEQLRELEGREINTHGFLGYPVLQAADILLYDADLVPVGEDQLPHLELTREIARRFNHFFGNTFKEPKPLLTPTPKVLGTDGRKMSKSYQNCIYLSDTLEEVEKKVKTMVTDPARQRRNDPGNPDVCPAFSLHKIFNLKGLDPIATGCRSASIGCTDCKKILFENMKEWMAPMIERRAYYASRASKVQEILEEGSHKARTIADKKLLIVRETIQI